MQDFTAWIQKLEPVDDKEPLARFLTQSNHVKSGHVSHRAFLPNPKTNNVSVYRTKGLALKSVWYLGDRRLRRKIYGIGEVTRTQVVDQPPLDVIPDKRPRRHANIVGWPPIKAHQMIHAKKLAANAKLQLRP